MIIFDHVGKHYGKRTILHDLSFEIKKSEFVSIVGNSGSGKSTIIKLINGQEHPSSGHVIVDGVEVSKLNHHKLQEYRQHIGTVFQDCLLLPQHTIFENVAFALEVRNFPQSKIYELTQAALDLVDLSGIQDNFPHQISGGEAARAALARAIVYKPKILLADEPTGHLDTKNAEKVLQSLLKINMHGTTVILTTHNRALVGRANERTIHI